MINRRYRPALKKAGIGTMRFHDLRYTKAGLMIDAGGNLKYVRTELGHSSPSITLYVYVRLLKDSDRDAVSRMQKGSRKQKGAPA